jgi:CBS domain containing-hemolysin-like protein
MIPFIIFVLIVLAALFAGGETALFSLRESQVRLMEKSGERNAHIITKLKRDPHRVLVTLLFGNTVVNITVGSLAAVLSAQESESLGIGVTTGIVTILILLFGEIFPKSYAISHNKKVMQTFAYPLYFLYLLFYPIATIFVFIEKHMKHISGGVSHDTVTEEEIRVMSDLGLEHGGIDNEERKLIDNIFQFDDITAGKAMTKKEHIDALSGDVPVTQIAYYVSQSGYSRFPVYEGNQNNFTGYVHTNDVMRVLNSDDREECLIGYASPLTRVPEDMDIRQVFKQMTKEGSHMYLVHKADDADEIVGLLTMEDILEEIMGEIEDEGDRREEGGK